MPLTPGTRLGPYEIVAPIGAGGMGEVYEARDERLERRVAIKLLPAAMATDQQARGRLRLEAMSAAALDHPYICKIFEIGEHAEDLFLVMEYIPGSTLHRRLHDGPMPLPEALRVAAEIADALEAAHTGRILHRDLKPANIMLTPQGHVKIMDFGLAKRFADTLLPAGDETAEMQPQLTAPGTILGTPDYMSPEQIKGLPLDARSDLFSFGVILAEMISGRHPFRKATTVETLSAVLSGQPDLSNGIPPRWSVLLQRLLAKDVEDRYPSIADVRADLARLDTSTLPTVSDAATTAMPRATAHASGRWIAIAVLAVLLAGLGAYWLFRPAAHVIRSLAVLPLANRSEGGASEEFFAEGMTDELTSDLATISGLRVISRGSAMQFKGEHRGSTAEIAKTLNIDAIVEGSVSRSGDRVRITAQLIDAVADKVLWSKNFERNSREVLAMQDELASAIASEIHVQLTPSEQSRLKSSPRVNPESYDAYLKGRYFFNRPSDENLKKAIDHFTEAVQLDPNFAPAYSGLSDAYLWAGYNEGFLTATEARSKAKAAAEKAIQLDDSSAEGHTSLAVFKLFYEYDWAGCEKEFRRAIALNSNYAFTHDQFGLGLGFQKRLDESLAEGKRASALDPLSPQIPIDMLLGIAWSGNYKAAKEEARKAAELDPSYYMSHWANGWIDIQAGKPHDAITELQKSKGMESPSFAGAWLGYAYGASGDRARAMAELEDQKKHALRGYVPAFNLALIHLGLGDRERALGYLEAAYATDSQWLGWLKNDRAFESLRSEPRFRALLKKLRFD